MYTDSSLGWILNLDLFLLRWNTNKETQNLFVIKQSYSVVLHAWDMHVRFLWTPILISMR